MAELLEVAAIALGFARVADLASVVDELVGESDPAILRENLHQLLFNFFCCFRFSQTEAACNAEDVRVYNDTFGLAETDTENHVCGFAGCAGDCDEFGEGLGNLTIEFVHDFSGRALDGFCLVAEEARGADEVFKFGERSLRHRRRSREAAEQFRGHHVHADIGALRGEDRGDKQFPWRVMRECAFDVGVGFVEAFEDGGDAVGG